MKRIISLLLTAVLTLMLCACAAPETGISKETRAFTDSCGREVTLPAEIGRIAPSGQTATMILTALAPEKLVCLGSKVREEQAKYFPDCLDDLPVIGHMYGGKSDLNLEELLATGAEVIIDLGEIKDSLAEDLDALQQQTGLPCVFIEADLAHMAEAFRTLGTLLGCEKRAEEIAAFWDDTLALAEENRARIPEGERRSVYYSSGGDPLGVNAEGSTQAQALALVGASNAVQTGEIINKSGGTLLDMERVYTVDPDVVLMGSAESFAEAAMSETWAQLRAVREGKLYRVPTEPYNWLSEPPSLNMALGVWWLGRLLYPDIYDYDMTEKTREIFRVLWQYDMSEEEADALLAVPEG